MFGELKNISFCSSEPSVERAMWIATYLEFTARMVTVFRFGQFI